MLLQIPNVLNGEEILKAKKLIAEAQWVDGKVTAGTQAATVKNNQQLPESAPQIMALRQLVLVAVELH